MTAAIGIETFIGSGLPQTSSTASRRARARSTCRPLTPRSSASARIRSARGSTSLCTGWPNPGTLLPASWNARAIAIGSSSDLQQTRALVRRAQHDWAGAEDPGRDGALQ